MNLVKKIFRNNYLVNQFFHKFSIFSPYNYSLNKEFIIKGGADLVRTWLYNINKKIKTIDSNSKIIDYNSYLNYFFYLKEINFVKEFAILTTKNNLILRGNVIFPIVENNNNNKFIIFCHGITEDRWSNFYVVHLALQKGYKVVIYDARNHGSSSKFSNTLGQIESFDLNDVIHLINRKYLVEKIAIYGFSMGASTCIFWLKYFWRSSLENKVNAIICDSVFDDFIKQKENIVGNNFDRFWKDFILKYGIKKRLETNYDNLRNISPIFNLPSELPVSLLLLHSVNDSFINWKSSLNIYQKLKRINEKNVSFYLSYFSDHGELPIISDYLPKPFYINGDFRKKSNFSFTALFFTFLEKKL